MIYEKCVLRVLGSSALKCSTGGQPPRQLGQWMRQRLCRSADRNDAEIVASGRLDFLTDVHQQGLPAGIRLILAPEQNPGARMDLRLPDDFDRELHLP